MPTLIAFGLPRLTLFVRDFQETPFLFGQVPWQDCVANIGRVCDTLYTLLQ